MTEHFTLEHAGGTMDVKFVDGVLRDGTGQAVCGRCGKPVERQHEWWRHALVADYMGGCWWGKPERVPDGMFGSSEGHLRLTPREVEQVEAALGAEATPIPELADAIRKVRTPS